MVRIVLGVIAGFVVWSIVWVGSEATVAALAPDWYGVKLAEAQKAMADGTPVVHDAGIALFNILRSFSTSFLAGYMCALVAGEYKRSTMVLGVILLIVGLLVEISFWRMAPAWYHIIFLIGLIPMTILGGRVRRPS